ncbi:MAG: lipopolysaccharide assembly protein LapB, partial [Burkholderiales bacterium]|nr:lipopolysaccharide assembly protein LapB [Burkholderiales bacterium]
LLAGQRCVAQGDDAGALAAWDALRACHPASFLLVAEAYAEAARRADRATAAHAALAAAAAERPALELLQALERLEPAEAPEQLPRRIAQLQQHPTLSGAQRLLDLPPASLTPAAWEALKQAVARSAAPLQRYRCAACGFEAQRYFWQCPGCLSWDSYPPQRIDAQ